MGQFNFDDYSSSLDPEELGIQCKKIHSHEILIVNAYDVDLYKAWSIELNDIYTKIENTNPTLVDLGLHLLDSQRSFFRQIGKRLLLLQIFRNIGNTQRYQIQYKKYDYKSNVYRSLMKAIQSTASTYKSNTLIKPKVQSHELYKLKSIFSTLATNFGTVEFNIRKNIIKLFILDLAFELSYNRTRHIIKKSSPCVLFVGNGRLVKAAAVVAASRENQIETIIIERGAFPGTFDLYRISPHSILERRNQVKTLVSKFGEENRQKIARNYIELRREFDPISGLKWQRNFEIGKLPPLDHRKICVCFTSTETEFAVFGDEIPHNNFQSQEEAFRALASALNPKEWQVVIRRHPYGTKKLKSDPEKKLWRKLSSFEHVRIIEPNDPVDSYELSRVADLVAHFNSSMGPEAIALETTPVITMGPTIWENEESPYCVHSHEKLQAYFLLPTRVREIKEIYNWGLYWATFGYKFKKVQWKSSKGFVNDRRIF